jgi:transaldolase
VAGCFVRTALSLRLFLDSADPEAWRQWLPTGLFHGVTTNPTLLQRAGQPCSLAGLTQLTAQALELGAREVQLQAWGGSSDAMQDCGQALAAIAPSRVVVKLPVTRQGSLAAHRLISAEIPVTLTACYEPSQVLVAAALGATYLAPYLGRINDLGRDGLSDLRTMQRCVDGLGSPLRLLVASVRQVSDLIVLASAGLTTFTISETIATGLFSAEATNRAALMFEQQASGLV